MKALPLVVSLILVLKDVDGVPEPTQRDTDTQARQARTWIHKKATLHTECPHKHMPDGICIRSHTCTQTQ